MQYVYFNGKWILHMFSFDKKIEGLQDVNVFYFLDMLQRV